MSFLKKITADAVAIKELRKEMSHNNAVHFMLDDKYPVEKEIGKLLDKRYKELETELSKLGGLKEDGKDVMKLRVVK